MKTIALALLVILACAAISGCGASPQVRFFTLASEPPRQRDSGASSAEFSIIVGPVTVPELVDRPQFVLRAAPGRVEIAEQARWAAPLKSEISRVVADHLARLLEGARTATWMQRAAGVPDYRVLIDVQRFETAPQKEATIQALWTVRSVDGVPPLTGRSIATETAGEGYDELVAAHSRALERVSRDIAAAIAAARGAK
jgi:uncharacterized protein